MTDTRKWDLRFLQLAELISTWSKDPSTKVGAVIVDQDRRIVSCGYNGFPAKIDDSPAELANRELKYSKIIHAERNALIFAKRDLTNCTLYTCPFFSCSQCTALVIQSGIVRFVTYKLDEDSSLYARWAKDIKISRDMYYQAGIDVLEYNKPAFMYTEQNTII